MYEIVFANLEDLNILITDIKDMIDSHNGDVQILERAFYPYDENEPLASPAFDLSILTDSVDRKDRLKIEHKGEEIQNLIEQLFYNYDVVVDLDPYTYQFTYRELEEE